MATSSSSDFFPLRAAGNPGQGTAFALAFRNDEREWTESLDLSALLRDALLARGQAAALARDGWVTLSDGLWLLPQILSYSRAEDGSVRTSSTIEVAHAGLLPQGVFEYQHSGGETTGQALTRGFDLWAQVDLVVFQDALGGELAHCTSMDMSWKEGRQRRVLFGPVAHRAALPAAEVEEEPQIESDGVYGLRLYAARDAEGEVQADCRVNGEDWPAGAEALRAYVTQWPDRGFEFRKQYVVIQSPPQARVAE
jgi:hypothetical protein